MTLLDTRSGMDHGRVPVPGRPPVLGSGRLPYLFSGALAVVALAAAAFSFTFPSLLTGVEVGKGNLRGTALVIGVVALPTLAGAMAATARGSARIWLPLLAAAAWRRQVWGLLVTGGMLVLYGLESVGVATDQWFGSRADPTSDFASLSAVPVFAVLAVVTLVPLVAFCRGLDEGPVRPNLHGRGR